MINEFKKHPVDYFLLFACSLIALIFFLKESVPQKRYTIILLYALCYFVWSLFHQIAIKKISVAIVLEYLLLIILALVVLKVAFFPSL